MGDSKIVPWFSCGVRNYRIELSLSPAEIAAVLAAKLYFALATCTSWTDSLLHMRMLLC